MLGEKVLHIMDKDLSKGEHIVSVSFANLPSGNYMLKFQSEFENQTLKMQLIK